MVYNIDGEHVECLWVENYLFCLHSPRDRVARILPSPWRSLSCSFTWQTVTKTPVRAPTMKGFACFCDLACFGVMVPMTASRTLGGSAYMLPVSDLVAASGGFLQLDSLCCTYASAQYLLTSSAQARQKISFQCSVHCRSLHLHHGSTHSEDVAGYTLV